MDDGVHLGLYENIFKAIALFYWNFIRSQFCAFIYLSYS